MLSDVRGQIMQLQQDRMAGNISMTTYDEQVANLRNMDAANWRQPPLPPAPCVRIKATGEIHEWAPFFAARPDLCECCDEKGNTDPAAWQGRKSPHFEDNVHRAGMPMAPMETPQETKAPTAPEPEKPVLPQAPAGAHFNMHEFTAGLIETDVPQTGAAHIILGVPQEKAKDYTQCGIQKAAMPLTGGNQPVSAAIQDFLSRTI